jgi:hypothetical protein
MKNLKQNIRVKNVLYLIITINMAFIAINVISATVVILLKIFLN